MIIQFNKKYDEQVKNLLVELQSHLVDIDKEKYLIVTKNSGEIYLKHLLYDVNKYKGKIFLYKEKEQIVGLVCGVVNNEEETTFETILPKRGRITELVVAKNYSGKGIGKQLLNKMEEYLLGLGCKDVLLSVYAYNEKAVAFYEKNGYHARMLTMTKKVL